MSFQDNVTVPGGLLANNSGSPINQPLNLSNNGSSAGSPEQPKSTLWMGELELWYDETAIRNIWASVGENVNVKLIRDKFSGVNAGYCFIDFATAASAQKALQTLNGAPIPNTNRVFRLNWASGGGLVDKRDDRGPEYSIFVGDLSSEVTEYALLQLFLSRYPSCKSAKIMTDPNTNLSRGYGFVRFSDETQMHRAMAEMQGFYLGNRPIRISTATPKGKSSLIPTGPAVANTTNGYGGLVVGQMALGNTGGVTAGGPGSYSTNVAPPANAYGVHGFYGNQPINQFTDPNNTTVFVGGLSSQVNEDELRRYFAPFGDITYVKIPPGKGCGFVQYVQRHSAETAITQMQGYPLGNSRVRLSWGRSNASGSPPIGAATANSGVGLGLGSQGATTGVSPSANSAYRASGPAPIYPQLGLGGQPQYGPYGPIVNGGEVDQQGVLLGEAGPAQPELTAVGQDPSEPVPVARLNELYLAARDGRLDRMEADGRGYHGVYAQ
jgi:RNA recognition motif-containing protein